MDIANDWNYDANCTFTLHCPSVNVLRIFRLHCQARLEPGILSVNTITVFFTGFLNLFQCHIGANNPTS